MCYEALFSAVETGSWSRDYPYNRYGNRSVTASTGQPAPCPQPHIATMATIGADEQAAPRLECRLCRAALEVRVGFTGKVIWTVDPDDRDFGNKEPELRGKHEEPTLVCSADPLHDTGFKLMGGEIAADS